MQPLMIIRLIACITLPLAVAASAAAGHHGPPDRLTPPPCAAEGGCIPNSGEYGHYQGRWRRWPGDYDEAFPTPAGDASQPALPDVEKIEPEVEDRQAPLPTEQEPSGDQDAEAAGSGEMELPPLPGLPALPGPGASPGTGSGPNGPPPAPGGPNAPPALPFGPPPGFGPPSGTGSAPASGGFGTPRQSRGFQSDGDEPPTLPLFGRSTAQGSESVSPVVFIVPAR